MKGREASDWLYERPRRKGHINILFKLSKFTLVSDRNSDERRRRDKKLFVVLTYPFEKSPLTKLVKIQINVCYRLANHSTFPGGRVTIKLNCDWLSLVKPCGFIKPRISSPPFVNFIQEFEANSPLPCPLKFLQLDRELK